MKYHFQGIAFRPRNVLIRRSIKTPKKTPPEQNLTYDGSIMNQIRQNLISIKDLLNQKYEKR